VERRQVQGWYGGSGKPSMIAEIESYLGQPVARAAQPAPIRRSISCPPTSSHRELPDLDKLANPA
jgi:hypothetical protein